MHALLENAITYSYDNSKVVVTGTVQRFNPNLSHPSIAGAFVSDGAGDEPGSDHVTGELPVVTSDADTRDRRGSGPAAPAASPVEPVFTPEILDQFSQSAPGAVGRHRHDRADDAGAPGDHGRR